MAEFTEQDKADLKTSLERVNKLHTIVMGENGFPGLVHDINAISHKIDSLPCELHTRIINDLDNSFKDFIDLQKKTKESEEKKKEKKSDRAFSTWQAFGLMLGSSALTLLV